MTQSGPHHPVTPDGRYFVHRGRLWRRTNPSLGEIERVELVRRLMAARRRIAAAKRDGHAESLRDARAAVDAAKHALGERGAVWWSDGAPDFNRRLVKNTPYAEWYRTRMVEAEAGEQGARRVE